MLVDHNRTLIEKVHRVVLLLEVGQLINLIHFGWFLFQVGRFDCQVTHGHQPLDLFLGVLLNRLWHKIILLREYKLFSEAWPRVRSLLGKTIVFKRVVHRLVSWRMAYTQVYLELRV